jgi:peptidoglycan/xylan/chitin deacetylase (PgdA/CDA1 family)
LIVDFDDFQQSEHRLDLLDLLHDANPAFRCTLFAIPANSDPLFWAQVPEWCELAIHGWAHPHPREAEHWSYEQALDVLLSVPGRFVEGFKAPGWQISNGTYRALLELDYWVADQPYNDSRRPDGLRVHRLGDGDHWHGHIPDVCGNGIRETWPTLLERVRQADSFQLVSEVVRPWVSMGVAA